MYDTNRAPILCQDYHYIQTDQNELPFEPCNPGVPPGVSKMIFELMVHLAKTVHLSFTDTNTISKQIETGFQMIHVT
jgi:hypothetical protein